MKQPFRLGVSPDFYTEAKESLNGVLAAKFANLPDIEGAVFPTIKQLNAASNLITQKWNAVVGVDIK